LELEKTKDVYSNFFPKEQPQLAEDKHVDDKPVRGTRSLEDIYQRCSLVTLELASYLKLKILKNGRKLCKLN